MSYNSELKLTRALFSNLTKLEELYLAGMNIEGNRRFLFADLKQLISLDLNGNLIEKIEARLFRGLDNLRMLNVSNNPVATQLPEGVLPPVPKRVLPKLEILLATSVEKERNKMVEKLTEYIHNNYYL